MERLRAVNALGEMMIATRAGGFPVKKGDKLYIEGELRTRSYDDAQGVKRYVTEIVATDMEMLTPKATGAGAQVPPPPVPDAPAPDGNDDLPF